MQASSTDFAPKRERSRSPRRRSRSPRHRRSYSPRSRSRSRGEGYRRSDRRSRSPGQSGAAAAGGYTGAFSAGRAPPARSFEDRGPPKEQPMSNLRENSQQDRRVYVGNLSYDVKWHHLKDFMRQGKPIHASIIAGHLLTHPFSRRGPVRRRITTSEWNEQGGLICGWLSGFSLVI